MPPVGTEQKWHSSGGGIVAGFFKNIQNSFQKWASFKTIETYVKDFKTSNIIRLSDVIIGGSLSLADIANMVTDENKDQEASDEEAVDAVQEEIISFQDAQKACFTLRKFMQQQSRGSDVMRACYLLDNEMHEIRRSNNRQMTIVECFGRR